MADKNGESRPRDKDGSPDKASKRKRTGLRRIADVIEFVADIATSGPIP